MKIDNSLTFGLSPTIQVANNIAASAALFPLKSDDADGHAKATADHIGGKDFADALDERSLIRRDADGRNKMVGVQKSLARPAGGVAVSQTMSGT